MEKAKKIIKRALVYYQINNNKNKYEQKIKKLTKGISKINKDQVYLDHLKKWRIFDKNVTGDWFTLYSGVSEVYSPNYVPESIYYSYLEPILNNYEHCVSYSDKNVYDLVYREGIFPTTLLRNISGSFYNQNYEPVNKVDEHLDALKTVYPELILKPSIASGGGVNVILFKLQEGKYKTGAEGIILNKDFLDKIYKSNYVIQQKLESHIELSKFNPSSLNTIRVLTYRSVNSNKINILNCVLRVGAEGAVVDNSRAGGVAIGIDSAGRLNNFATDKSGSKKFKLSEYDLSKKFSIPKFDNILQLAKTIAAKNIHHRLLGLDMVVNESGNINCVEVNNKGNEINFFQFNNGPLFGEFTDEIAEYCFDNMSKIYRYYAWK